MDDGYYSKDGIKSIGQLKRLKRDLYDSFFEFDRKVFAAGSLSSKYKELIAVGCAHVTRCPYCIDAHVRRAKETGAADEEIAEAIFVSAAMNAGAAMAHSCISMDVLAGGNKVGQR